MSSQTELEPAATTSVTATPTAPLSTSEILDRDGYVIIPSVLSESELTSLRRACHEVTDLARAGKWPYLRTLPKQFPPWSSDPSNGIWGVQHLLHPEMPNQPEFASTYFADFVLNPVKEIIGVGDDNDLIMELYNLLVRPDKDFELRWHRDDIPPTATDEEELERLNKPGFHAQWNLALYDDSSLIAIPGSHKRARTSEERNADPFQNPITGQQIVTLKAGDIIFYNNNFLHRGVYNPKIERMTLHGSIGHKKANQLRARNVLQHGVGDWVDKVDFSPLSDHLRTRAEGMRKNLFEMGRDSGNVGFAQDD